MKAEFASTCPGCHGVIAPGAIIGRSSRGFMHFDCASAERDLRRNRELIEQGDTISTPRPYRRKLHRA